MTDEYCNRLDSCNILRGSVGECIDSLDTELDDLSSSDRAEVEHLIQMCLDHPSCNGFSSCVAELTQRTASSSVTVIEPAQANR